MGACFKQNRAPVQCSCKTPPQSPIKRGFLAVRSNCSRHGTRRLLSGNCQTLELQWQWGLQELVLAGITSILSASLFLCPGAAFADPPLPAPTTEVPAAVNAVNTESNAQLQQEEEAGQQDSSRENQSEDKQQVSLDLSRDGSPMGTVVLRVFREPPLGTQRFLQLAQRSAGGYRLSRVDGISDEFVTFNGTLQLNYTGIPTLAGGDTVEQLEAEQSVYSRSHDKAGLVSLIVEDAGPRDVRDKIVAYKGKFIKVQEVRGASNANGTGFAVTLGPAPLLDKTNLIVGEVVEGLDVLMRISTLPKVKSSSTSPFFKVAKALGDRRADVAARSFGKPLGRITIEKISVR